MGGDKRKVCRETQQSTADGIYLLNSVVDKWTSRNNGRLFTAMIDFQKAYDYVVHNNVWAKLIQKGVTGRILAVVQSTCMYRQMKNRIRNFDGKLSEPFSGVIGLRQGESLSPLLFSFVVNDIETELRRSQGNKSIRWEHVITSLLMYADDLCLIADSADNLQDALNILDSYCTEWNLKVNAIKSKVMIFSKKEVEDLPEFMSRGETLEIVNNFKYLGAVFTRNGSWDTNVSTLCGQARKAIMSLRQRF